jgi:hypothetical protein
LSETMSARLRESLKRVAIRYIAQALEAYGIILGDGDVILQIA